MASHYKGKPENFNPDKLGQGRRKSQKPTKSANLPTQRVKAPPITKLPIPEFAHCNTNPTPHKNHSLLDGSIFGCEVMVVPIAPNESFTPIFAVYREYAKDVLMIERKMIKEEMSYYFTGLLWLRLLDIKQKYGKSALTTEEKTLLKDTKEDTYNVPQPYFSFTYRLSVR